MKKLFFRLGIFGLFLSCVWGFLFLACSQWYSLESALIGKETNWGSVNQRSAEWGSQITHSQDVLFFGPSTCYSGINPASLDPYGISGFNFCSSAQGLRVSELLLSAAISESDPGVIVCDIYPSNWGSKSIGLESVKDWMINSNLRSPTWSTTYRKMAIESGDFFNMIQLFYFDWIRTEHPAGKSSQLEIDTTGIYQGNGWVERTFPPLDSFLCETEIVAMSDYECEVIRSIQTLCVSRGIEFILLNPPQLCEEEFQIPMCFENIIFIDGNNWPGAKKVSNYYDDHHLVGDGARDYSAWLAGKIVEHARP